MAKQWDCLVIGGGPAGLTAAIYLARFHLRVTVVDEGLSRAATIPCTRNHAGYPGGIAGTDLLERMRQQALEYGAELKTSRVTSLRQTQGGFRATTNSGDVDAQAVLVATGVTNYRPKMPDALHDAALKAGRLRYCPVCDGFEVTDQRVAVIGTGNRGLKEAIFLRSFTKQVSLAPFAQSHTLSNPQRRQLTEAGVVVLEAPACNFQLEASTISFAVGGRRHRFDAIYPALGSRIHSSLAAGLGADRTEEGCIKVDAHQRTSIPFLHAAGDVVVGLDQISHAMGEGGVAATTIRNDLAERSPLWR